MSIGGCYRSHVECQVTFSILRVDCATHVDAVAR
jgi:hypothetical protein